MASTVAAPKIELFKGTGWEECEAFIRDIRAVAWKEDKLEDNRWIANYASLHLSRKALKWHSRLPPDIRLDWSKLEIALLDQWHAPSDDDDNDDAELSIAPTPAAAPDPLKQSAAKGGFHYVIKIIAVESNAQFYLGYPDDSNGKCVLTKEISNAMRVLVDVQNNPHTIEVSHKERRPRHNYSWLAIHWSVSGPEPQVRPGSETWARISLIDSISLKSSYNFGSAPFRVTAWDISVTGDILATWFQGEQKTTLDVYISTSSLGIATVPDSSAYSRVYPSDVRARMFLQRLN